MLDLHFAMRYIAVLGVGGEVGITRDADGSEVAGIQTGPQPLTLFRVVVEHRKMRAFGHEHHAFESQLRRFVDELIERKKRLAPKTGVAYGVKKEGSHRRFHSKVIAII